MHVVGVGGAFSVRGPEGTGFVCVDAFWLLGGGGVVGGGVGLCLGGAGGVVGGAFLALGGEGCE